MSTKNTRSNRLNHRNIGLFAVLLILGLLVYAKQSWTIHPNVSASTLDLSGIPEYSSDPFVAINDNVPEFSADDLTDEAFETYGNLDSLGRCSVAYASIGKELMPTEERGSIGQIKPSGWQTVKYDFVDGKYLYNRCHLIGYQLTAENANDRNLITGTRYLNVEGMLPFENFVADYVKETRNHVMYRVTPVFEGDNLVASGVHMEAESVEDQGEGILFNVYCYNVQPGVRIDYATGESELASPADAQQPSKKQNEKTYVLNLSSRKFHDPSCRSVARIKDDNKQEFRGTREEVLNMGYEPCNICHP